MTNQQGAPEALRLADWLQNAVATYPQVSEDEPGGYCQEVDQVMDEAATELRRLHAENVRLAALVEAQQPAPSAAADWKLVPEGPTPDMVRAGWELLPSATGDRWDAGAVLARSIYSAMLAAAPQPSPTPQADSARDEFISREEWVERAMRVYLIAGDTEDEARECAEYQWGELDMDDIPDPYFTAMEDIEGRGPAPQADSAPHPIDLAIAADLERSDWTPEEALRWYAAGKHYDTVPNGDGSSSARILDNGAVASNALKSLSREYAQHKGDVALTAPQADSQPAPKGETNVQLDIDSNHSTPEQQRDVAGSVALGQPVGNGSDQAAGHTGAQGDKLLIVAERNIRSFLRSAVFKSESDREAALNCVDVLWEAASAPADSVLEDAARYRFLAEHCRSTSEHWGGRWSIIINGPAPKSHDSEDDFDEAVDAARKQGANHD